MFAVTMMMVSFGESSGDHLFRRKYNFQVTDEQISPSPLILSWLMIDRLHFILVNDWLVTFYLG